MQFCFQSLFRKQSYRVVKLTEYCGKEHSEDEAKIVSLKYDGAKKREFTG